MVDAAGTTKYTYTAASQLLVEDGPWASDNVTNSYHASVPGLRTGVSVQQPTGTWAVTETPDAAKRLASVTSAAGTFTYTYKGPSLVWTNLASPNVAAITNSLDSVGRLTGTSLMQYKGTGLTCIHCTRMAAYSSGASPGHASPSLRGSE